MIKLQLCDKIHNYLEKFEKVNTVKFFCDYLMILIYVIIMTYPTFYIIIIYHDLTLLNLKLRFEENLNKNYEILSYSLLHGKV